MIDTIGFLELNSIAKGLEAADAMLKKADVDLIFAKPGCPGKYYILVIREYKYGLGINIVYRIYHIIGRRVHRLSARYKIINAQTRKYLIKSLTA